MSILGDIFNIRNAIQQHQLGAQQLQSNDLNRQMLMAKLKAYQDAYGPSTQGASPQPGLLGASAQPGGLLGASPSTPGVTTAPYTPAQSAPMGAPAQSAPAAPAWLTPPNSAAIYGQPVNGMNAQALQRLAMLNGQDPMTVSTQMRAQQLKQSQQQYAPIIAKLDTVRQADHPAQYLQADPALASAWPHLAQELGLDAAKPTDQSVRTALTYARNNLAGSLSEATAAPTVPLQNITLPDGRTAQVDPVTGKQTILAPSPLTPIVGPGGKPVLKPTALAAGASPYNAQTYIQNGPGLDDQAQAVANYRQPLPSGFSARSAYGQALMAKVYQINPNYDATQYTAKQKGYNAFTSGKQGDTVRSLSVAVNHLGTLDGLVDALQNNDVKALNTIGNRWQQETGNPAPTNFDTAKNIVADEVTKAVIGYGGSTADREKAADVINRANSPAQLKGAIATYEKLMGGQLDGLRRQYEKATGRDDFDSMLSPQAQQLGAPTPSGHPSDIDALLKKYQ